MLSIALFCSLALVLYVPLLLSLAMPSAPIALHLAYLVLPTMLSICHCGCSPSWFAPPLFQAYLVHISILHMSWCVQRASEPAQHIIMLPMLAGTLARDMRTSTTHHHVAHACRYPCTSRSGPCTSRSGQGTLAPTALHCCLAPWQPPTVSSHFPCICAMHLGSRSRCHHITAREGKSRGKGEEARQWEGDK